MYALISLGTQRNSFVRIDFAWNATEFTPKSSKPSALQAQILEAQKCRILSDTSGRQGFGPGARWTSRIWSWRMLGFEGFGLERAWLRRHCFPGYYGSALHSKLIWPCSNAFQTISAAYCAVSAAFRCVPTCSSCVCSKLFRCIQEIIAYKAVPSRSKRNHCVQSCSFAFQAKSVRTKLFRCVPSEINAFKTIPQSFRLVRDGTGCTH